MSKAPAPIPRRHFLGLLISGGVTAAGVTLGFESDLAGQVVIRPPGALPEGDFQRTCIRCTRCADACPNQCIQFLGLDAGPADALTPVIVPRQQGCILCTECTKVCPTGALQPFAPDEESLIANVQMGVARVNRDMCYSFAGRTCGACFRACPLPNRAMRIGMYETPIVNRDECVGCGLCEQACIHLPQAIRVLPVARDGEVSS